ncbi:MAG TPA: potassium transporter TrkG [Sumerlaeia bacterium]|nr:potassium transporter TrkG [Sumerlaeia bacterium]
MSFFIILKLLGLLLMTVGASMLPSLAWSVYYADGAQIALLGAVVVTTGMGAAAFFVGRSRREDLFRKEATAVVGIGWILCAFAGALPFYFHGVFAGGPFSTFPNCYFESMSGLTTTGASVLQAEDFAALPRGLHFWRCFTHWLGGMGIIVLFVAILPFLGVGGRALLKSEVPGPVTETLTPRVKDTAMLLWKIYCGFTIAETLVLMACGMSFFDALCHTFATLATGGFSTNPGSIAGFDNLGVEIAIMFFMLVAGTNFALYYSILRGDRRALLRDPEWRAYVSVIAVSALFVAFVLVRAGVYASPLESLRYGTFQVLSLMTTTGFATANFDAWPVEVKFLLLCLMFVGGSAGSTGGGIKVMRWMILAKTARGELERRYSPRTVRKLRLGKTVLSNDLSASVLVFSFTWALVFVLGVFAVAVLEALPAGTSEASGSRLVTVITAVIATLNNIGPGLGQVGAEGNYAFFKPITKILLTCFMVLGRLELYTILVLFAPRFWRGR